MTTVSSTSSPTSRRSIFATPPTIAFSVEDRGLQDLLPAEGQELPRQIRRALAGAQDLRQVVAHRVPRLETGAEHLAVAEDDRQEIVEVVRDPARELADGLHLLSLAELPLHPVALRHVQRDGEVAWLAAEQHSSGP